MRRNLTESRRKGGEAERKGWAKVEVKLSWVPG